MAKRLVDNAVLVVIEKLKRATPKELKQKTSWKGLVPIMVDPKLIDSVLKRLLKQGKLIKDGTAYRPANPRLGRITPGK